MYRCVVYRWLEQNHSDGTVIQRKISSVIQSVPENVFPRYYKSSGTSYNTNLLSVHIPGTHAVQSISESGEALECAVSGLTTLSVCTSPHPHAGGT